MYRTALVEHFKFEFVVMKKSCIVKYPRLHLEMEKHEETAKLRLLRVFFFFSLEQF